MFGHWLDKLLNGATTVRRWQGRRTLISKNDAEHMWGVAVISEILARIQQDKFGESVDVAELLRRCILHDVVEIETGDIPSGVKRKTKEMKLAVDGIEKAYYNEGLKPLIPKKYRKDYERYLLDPKEGKQTTIGKIIAVADNIDALNECIQEVKLGNLLFKNYLSEVTNSILDIDIGCRNYFIKYCLVDFELPISDYGPRVVEFVKTYEFEENTVDKKNI